MGNQTKLLPLKINPLDIDQEFAQLQKERNCFHLKDKFHKFLSKKKLPHLDKNTQYFYYQQIIKLGENKCLCECLNSIWNKREGKYYQLSEKQKEEIKELKDKLRKQKQENNKLQKVLNKIQVILPKSKNEEDM